MFRPRYSGKSLSNSLKISFRFVRLSTFCSMACTRCSPDPEASSLTMSVGTSRGRSIVSDSETYVLGSIYVSRAIAQDRLIHGTITQVLRRKTSARKSCAPVQFRCFIGNFLEKGVYPETEKIFRFEFE